MSSINDRGAPRADKRISTCKRCRYGIFKGQEYTWQSRPAPGFVHTDCLP